MISYLDNSKGFFLSLQLLTFTLPWFLLKLKIFEARDLDRNLEGRQQKLVAAEIKISLEKQQPR